jgi:hypothetical protein
MWTQQVNAAPRVTHTQPPAVLREVGMRWTGAIESQAAPCGRALMPHVQSIEREVISHVGRWCDMSA